MASSGTPSISLSTSEDSTQGTINIPKGIIITSNKNGNTIKQLLENLQAVCRGQEPPYPELLSDDDSSSEQSAGKKQKTEEVIDLGYGPGCPMPPKQRPNFGGTNEEVDDLFWQIKLACIKDTTGQPENHHLIKIIEILSEKPELINEKATHFSVPLINEAVCEGAVNVTKELLNFNPDLLLTNGFGETCLKRGIQYIKMKRSPSVMNCCIEILKYHFKNETIDTSVFDEKITETDDWVKLICDMGGIRYENMNMD